MSEGPDNGGVTWEQGSGVLVSVHLHPWKLKHVAGHQCLFLVIFSDVFCNWALGAFNMSYSLMYRIFQYSLNGKVKQKCFQYFMHGSTVSQCEAAAVHSTPHSSSAYQQRLNSIAQLWK